jgi:hypothetical protein
MRQANICDKQIEISYVLLCLRPRSNRSTRRKSQKLSNYAKQAINPCVARIYVATQQKKKGSKTQTKLPSSDVVTFVVGRRDDAMHFGQQQRHDLWQISALHISIAFFLPLRPCIDTLSLTSTLSPLANISRQRNAPRRRFASSV